MRYLHIIAAAACALAVSVGPALAQDAMMADDAMAGDAMMADDAMAGDAMAGDSMAGDVMGTMGMMEGGEVMTFMPDGHMGKTVLTDQMSIDAMMTMATPLDHCLMILTGPDGKVYVVDTSSDEANKECEAMAM